MDRRSIYLQEKENSSEMMQREENRTEGSIFKIYYCSGVGCTTMIVITVEYGCESLVQMNPV